jgi:hypothetical protein
MLKAQTPRKRGRLQRVVPPEPVIEPPAIVQRPDGYYCQAPDGHQEFGPFESYELAREHRDAVGDEALAPGETLQQAEHELGIADWIDAETGEPAEGESPPHLRED